MDEEDACSLKIRAGQTYGEVQFKARFPIEKKEGERILGGAASLAVIYRYSRYLCRRYYRKSDRRRKTLWDGGKG